jgi:hypothetical protein
MVTGDETTDESSMPVDIVGFGQGPSRQLFRRATVDAGYRLQEKT